MGGEIKAAKKDALGAKHEDVKERQRATYIGEK